MPNIQEAAQEAANEAARMVEGAARRMESSLQEGLAKGKEQVEAVLHREVDFTLVVPAALTFAIVWSVLIRRYDRVDKEHFVASSIHAVVSVAFAAAHLLWGLDEMWLFLLMSGYFMADAVHYCLEARYLVFLLHHVLALAGLFYMTTSGHLAARSFASKAVMVEISTPFMNMYNDNKTVVRGILFLASFFLVRVAWLLYLVAQGIQVYEGNVELLVMLVFSGLNVFWFLQIVAAAVKSMNDDKPPPPAEIAVDAVHAKLE